MVLSAIAKIAFGSFTVAEALQLTTTQQPALLTTQQPTNDAEIPRMLLMRGCDGQHTISQIAQDLMVGHGYDIVFGEEMLHPETSPFLEGNDPYNLTEAIEMAYEKAVKDNKTIVFKATSGGRFRSMWPQVNDTLAKMGALLVVGSRENMLDEVVCRARNCLEPDYGFPTNASGVDLSETACPKGVDFSERTHNGQRQFTVHLDNTTLVRYINKEFRHVKQATARLNSTNYAYTGVVMEKLIGYTSTDAQEDLDIAVAEWTVLLDAWGVKAETQIIKKRLKKDQDTNELPKRKAIIKNFYECLNALKEKPEYEPLLCGVPSECASD